ncbi:hypothetical protein BpOF4_17350 [Alkalihalophilus pseudofirmus OF4]|uniref:Uncharacterized protein n=1 Tax=Alkalihalophilus pseudofirmus (strain ATCC BAA-2126 / JCM 17055 / OF4) TaxID=398511 RepID=D3FRC0_ALKPO|nr:hypothetical protein BpOF4_17350 [Alkalihalophilus pseudofirmus OF4]
MIHRYLFYSTTASFNKISELLVLIWGAANDILAQLIVAEGTDSSGMCVARGDPTGRKPEEAPGSPAECVCLQWKSTYTIGKNIRLLGIDGEGNGGFSYCNYK